MPKSQRYQLTLEFTLHPKVSSVEGESFYALHSPSLNSLNSIHYLNSLNSPHSFYTLPWGEILNTDSHFQTGFVTDVSPVPDSLKEVNPDEALLTELAAVNAKRNYNLFRDINIIADIIGTYWNRPYSPEGELNPRDLIATLYCSGFDIVRKREVPSLRIPTPKVTE